ncbi:HSF-type DNA-binding-domain-containing protein [Chlamydoabsidia padenii]|nr:HSF-type DNA-binding-domain-containing protein [Chlamydoabsidia padenii]
MNEKKKRQQQQQQKRQISSSSPPSSSLPPTSIVSSPVSSTITEDYSWGHRSTTSSAPPSSLTPLPPPLSPIEVMVNDRFIHETGPPTALSILRTQPAFIGKLYKMLEDSTQDMICWSSNGEYFSVYNSALFSKEVLPQYFKHNNWQSFVRQLNMYGFSKINEMIHSNISFDNQTWDFKHPHFKRGDFQSLILVKRKPVRPSSMTLSGASSTGTTPSIVAPSSPFHQVSNSGTNSPDGRTGSSSSSSSSPSSSHQQPQQQLRLQYPQDQSMEEETNMENKILQLDEQVYQVSSNVGFLTNEIQDIKSLIQKQQTMIHDLANLVRSYNDSSSSAAVAKVLSSTNTNNLDNPRHCNTSLPSIHNLANSLDTVTTIRAHDRQQHHHPMNVTSFFNNESGPSMLDHYQRRSASPPLMDHHQRRRFSHPTPTNTSRSSNQIHPLLNDDDHENDKDNDNDDDLMDENH